MNSETPARAKEDDAYEQLYDKTLGNIRRLAKLNLCEECYLKYTAIIEPNIQPLLQPLSDWRKAEFVISLAVMSHRGVFDKDDIETFHKILKGKFYRKLEYLRKHGIIQNSSYEFLYKVSNIRNRIHLLYNFTEEDMKLFSSARIIAERICVPIITDWGEDAAHTSATWKSDAEKMSERLLQEFEAVMRPILS